MADNKTLTWHYTRLGGIDQVTLQSLDEMRNLQDLDAKCWAALSCPVEGLEFDRRTLELLDTDNDGRIRMPEVLEAAQWLCSVTSPNAVIQGEPGGVPLAAIDTGNAVGERLATTAGMVLQRLGKQPHDLLTPADMRVSVDKAVHEKFNGDAIFPVRDDLGERAGELVRAGVAIVGAVRDASGEPGLNMALAEALGNELKGWLAWREEVAAAPHPVEGTEEAWALLEKVRGKIDDFFLRCNLAGFAPQAQTHLNREEHILAVAEADTMQCESIGDLPLANITADASLPLTQGLNPSWKDAVQRLAQLTKSLRASEDVLLEQDWQAMQAVFAPFGAALAKKPALASTQGVDFPAENPVAAIEAMDEATIRRLLEPETLAAFKALCDEDLSSATAMNDIATLEKFVLLYCNLHRFTMNFVSFHDFYSMKPNVLFRAGTLYMDGRSCQLCLPVADVGKHSALANRSGLCLLYCQCTRRNDDGAVVATRTIVAALTAGGDDGLVEGRNGVFVDNTGQDWDATLTKIVHNPISLRQAMWMPYKRLAQYVGEAIRKFAEARRAQSLATAQARVLQSGAAAVSPAQAPAAAAPFDMGRNVGIFAAVGIALGAIGTAIGSIANALFSLSWWQFPLLFAGIFLAISGPSIFLAWLSIRKRELGALLEASGWAINHLLPINLKLGQALTALPRNPKNMERDTVVDPFSEEQESHWGLWLGMVVLAALLLGGWLWQSGHMAKFLGSCQQTGVTAPTAPAEAPAEAPAPAKDAAK